MKAVVTRVRAKPLTRAEESRLDREVRDLARLSTSALKARARPLTPAEKAQWAHAQRAGKTHNRKSARVSLTIEPELLEQADSYARAHRLTRAQLIANGLRSVMSA